MLTARGRGCGVQDKQWLMCVCNQHSVEDMAWGAICVCHLRHPAHGRGDTAPPPSNCRVGSELRPWIPRSRPWGRSAACSVPAPLCAVLWGNACHIIVHCHCSSGVARSRVDCESLRLAGHRASEREKSLCDAEAACRASPAARDKEERGKGGGGGGGGSGWMSAAAGETAGRRGLAAGARCPGCRASCISPVQGSLRARRSRRQCSDGREATTRCLWAGQTKCDRTVQCNQLATSRLGQQPTSRGHCSDG